jgi:hypothetical protein
MAEENDVEHWLRLAKEARAKANAPETDIATEQILLAAALDYDQRAAAALAAKSKP